MSTETCTICGSDKGKPVAVGTEDADCLCYVCSGWFLVECQRRTGFGNTIVVVVEPKDGGEGTPTIGKKKVEFIN